MRKFALGAVLAGALSLAAAGVAAAAPVTHESMIGGSVSQSAPVAHESMIGGAARDGVDGGGKGFPGWVDKPGYFYGGYWDLSRVRIGAGYGWPTAFMAHGGDQLRYHCSLWVDGAWWDRIDDTTHGGWGWTRDDNVWWPGNITPCVHDVPIPVYPV